MAIMYDYERNETFRTCNECGNEMLGEDFLCRGCRFEREIKDMTYGEVLERIKDAMGISWGGFTLYADDGRLDVTVDVNDISRAKVIKVLEARGARYTVSEGKDWVSFLLQGTPVGMDFVG